MTEQVDLDALEALAAELDNFGAGTHEYAMPEFVGESADAMFALIAELRQERERARDAESRMLMLDQANDEEIDRADIAEAALSRAEETIEKVRRSIPSENPELIEAGYAVPAGDLLGIIATYDQQT